MVIAVKHKFISPIADSPDPDIIQPSDWNDDHEIIMPTNALLGRNLLGTGPAVDILVGEDFEFSSGELQAGGRLGRFAKLVTNFNDAKDSGWYRGNAPLNSPGAGWWYVETVAHTSAYCTQTAYAIDGVSANDTQSWQRHYIAGSWGSWYRLRLSLAEQQRTWVGVVSQSGGVPTGAIIQRTSNANGEYTRYADGTQICTITRTLNLAIANAYGSLFQTTSSWTFPAAFSSAPAVACSEFKWSNGASWGAISAVSTSSALLRVLDVLARASATTTYSAVAVGRWVE